MTARPCAEMREQISAWLDGELTPDNAAVVRNHVATCPQCQRVVDSYRSIAISIRDLPPVTPPLTLADEIFAQTIDAGQPRLLWRGSRIGYGFAGIAAVLAMFVVAGYLLVGGYQRSIEPNVASSVPAQEDVWPIHRPVRITFNKSMNHDSVIAALAITPAGEAERLGAIWDGQTLVIGSEQLLKPDTTYTIRITNKAEDTWGNNLNQPYELRFTTSTTIQTPATPTATPSSIPTASPTSSPSATPTEVAVEAPAATASPNGPNTIGPAATMPPKSTATPTLPAVASTSTPGRPGPTATTAPMVTPTPDDNGSEEPTATATVEVPATATVTPMPTATATATIAPTQTPQPIITATATPTLTATIPVATETPVMPTQTPSTVPVVGAIGSIYWNNPAVQDRLGVAMARENRIDAQLQGFQRADMLYRADTSTIYVLPTSGLWSSYVNTASELPIAQPGPEEGTWQPGGVIGALWAAEQSVNGATGYAISELALAFSGTVQTFEGGTVLVSPTSIYIIFDAGDWEFYPNTGEAATP